MAGGLSRAPLGSEDGALVLAGAKEMENAITALLHDPNPAARSAANAWLTAYCGQPVVWTVVLYLAFPPEGVGVGSASDVRFFALNVLLNKMRADWGQLSPDDAWEIYEALMRQLPGSANDPVLRSRLCIVIGAAAAVAGAHVCYEVSDAWEVYAGGCVGGRSRGVTERGLTNGRAQLGGREKILGV